MILSLILPITRICLGSKTLEHMLLLGEEEETIVINTPIPHETLRLLKSEVILRTSVKSEVILQTSVKSEASGTMSETTKTTPMQPQEIRPFRCDLCNITCNTEDLLQKHKRGKKHLNCLQKPASAPKMLPPPVILQNGAPKPDFIRCDLCNVVCNNQDIYQKHVVGKKHSAKALMQLASKNGFFAATSNSSGASQKKPNTFQCGLCKITCTSNELLSMHIAGKKHLNKLRESGLIPNLPLTPMVNSESNEGKTVNSDGCNMNGKRAGSYVDVESKKQKIMQGGAPLNAIRTCTLCNVVCNSPTVFDAHLAGQKHAAMVVQQAENLTTGQES